MPVPKLRKNEKKKDYISRFMADPIMLKEYSDANKRFVVANSYWDNRRKK